MNFIPPNQMVLEDIVKIYWDGYFELKKQEGFICKLDGYHARTLAGVGIHMKKVHKIYAARGDRKRQLYHFKDILPGS